MARKLVGAKQGRRGLGFALAAAACCVAGPTAGTAAEPVRWASRVVHGVLDGDAVYESGLGIPLTFGPFGPSNPLWRDPNAAIGPPNTIDYDDLTGFGPVPGGFAGGPMRRLHLAWPAWQWGSADPALLGTRPGWLDGRRQNGVGLSVGSQVTVEFDEPVMNNDDDGGSFHWGIDLIVHGNAAFSADRALASDSDLSAVVLTGGLLAEPVEIAVAQHASGPWFVSSVPGDALFPTHPWSWDRDAGEWSGEAQDWGRPVDPALVIGDFVGLSAADAADLYAGSAGGAGIDLDNLVDENGHAASVDWIRFVRFRDPAGYGGEICAAADVPAGPGCGIADLADPVGVLDLADITAFVGAFTGSAGPGSGPGGIADIAAPVGVLDLADITAFVAAFVGGCP